MTFPLIAPDWDFALWAVLVGVASFGFWGVTHSFMSYIGQLDLSLQSWKEAANFLRSMMR